MNGRKGRRTADRVGAALGVGLIGTLALMALVVGGLASAAGWFSPAHQLTSTGTATSPTLNWYNAYYTTSSSWVVCGAGGLGNGSLASYVHATNLGPGDYCVARGVLQNPGPEPLTIWVSTVASTYDPACFYFVNTLSNSGPALTIGPAMDGLTYSFPMAGNGAMTLAAGASTHFAVAVGVWSTAPSTCEGTTGTFVVSLSGVTPVGNGP